MKKRTKNSLAILNADWKQFPSKPISLLEIMKELDANSLIITSIFIDEKIGYLRSKPTGYVLNKKDKNGFNHLLKHCIGNTFYNLRWMRAHASAQITAGWIYEAKKVSAETLLHELTTLRGEIQTELLQRHFIIIDPWKVGFYRGGEMLFGRKVVESFPSAKNEIESAANCLALDLNTAAIFHLMRAAEFGMRALAVHLHVKLKRKPIEHGGWNELIEQIEFKIRERRQRYDSKRKKNKKELEFLKFCRMMADELFIFKEIWRNNTMHSISSYNEAEAKGAFDRVRDFMQRLSKEVSETNS